MHPELVLPIYKLAAMLGQLSLSTNREQSESVDRRKVPRINKELIFYNKLRLIERYKAFCLDGELPKKIYIPSFFKLLANGYCSRTLSMVYNLRVHIKGEQSK